MRLLPLCLLLLSACPLEPKPPPAPSGCPDACSHMRQLDCELGRPTPRGATCEDVCEGVQRNGVDFNTGCLSAAPSCAAADEC